jgi:YfiH family protein
VFTFRDGRVGDLRVQVAFTDVHLDLAEGAPGRDEAIEQLELTLGTRIVRMHQVHGADVAVVDGVPAVPAEADALVTIEPGLALMTRAADCVPILLADADRGVAGAIHAGRKGTALDIATATVVRMRDLGARQVTAWVGPHICGRCYEVPAEMRAEVAARVPSTYAETRWGTPGLDLGAGVTAQLEAAGCTIVSMDRCTYEDPRLHSHRRDGSAAGRLAGLIWIEP